MAGQRSFEPDPTGRWRGEVRRTYKRSDFAAAWDYSKRTVYLIHPRDWKIPSPSNGEWLAFE